MTKEKLYKEIIAGMDVSYAHKKALDEFFDSNVGIPKGTNRHPYADVLHQWIEGAEIQKTTGNDCWHTMLGIVEFMDVEARTVSQHYRIKPPEPVWEYQYACVDEDGKGYITEFYAPGIEGIPSDGILLEGTKRVRRSE